MLSKSISFSFIKSYRNLATLTRPPFSSASLLLDSGEKFTAKSFGADKPITSGEVVFTTSLVGYPESMSDPSYHSQILVFTQPIVGNYGVPSLKKDQFGLFKHFESGKIQCAGIVVNDYALHYSHWNAIESLGEWCIRHGIPAISGVDTRAVVTLLRDQGTTTGHLVVGEENLSATPPPYANNSSEWISKVSTKEIKTFNPAGKYKVALLDCGAKQNIIRCLAERDAQVTVFPHDFDFSESLSRFDGVFLSNGPGDPKEAKQPLAIVKNLLKNSSMMDIPVPIFGICMGHQLLGLATGMKSFKLPYGNRGHNQPCINLKTGKCVITSQNHGYALDDSKMPDGWVPYFRNANDGSNEGIIHESLPFGSVQFHPEAKGGPLDTQFLFTDFMKQVKENFESKSSKGSLSLPTFQAMRPSSMLL